MLLLAGACLVALVGITQRVLVPASTELRERAEFAAAVSDTLDDGELSARWSVTTSPSTAASGTLTRTSTATTFTVDNHKRRWRRTQTEQWIDDGAGWEPATGLDRYATLLLPEPGPGATDHSVASDLRTGITDVWAAFVGDSISVHEQSVTGPGRRWAVSATGNGVVDLAARLGISAAAVTEVDVVVTVNTDVINVAGHVKTAGRTVPVTVTIQPVTAAAPAPATN